MESTPALEEGTPIKIVFEDGPEKHISTKSGKFKKIEHNLIFIHTKKEELVEAININRILRIEQLETDDKIVLAMKKNSEIKNEIIKNFSKKEVKEASKTCKECGGKNLLLKDNNTIVCNDCGAEFSIKKIIENR